MQSARKYVKDMRTFTRMTSNTFSLFTKLEYYTYDLLRALQQLIQAREKHQNFY